MKVSLPERAIAVEGSLVVLEIEFTSTARRLAVETSGPIEALDLHAEGPGGAYVLSSALSRVHVPLRVTRGETGDARVAVTLEDAAGGVAPERWEGTVHLEAPATARSRGAMIGLLLAFAAIAAGLVAFVVVPLFRAPRVPQVLGRPRDQAEAALRSLGFVVATRTVEAHAAKDVGRVVEQVPAAGVEVPRGRTVSITVGRALEVAAAPTSSIPASEPAPTPAPAPREPGPFVPLAGPEPESTPAPEPAPTPEPVPTP
ncbi:MAG TPA: PASTA domain-containing protein, partial [Planctomycetota bacterium]|nr:PASTA domain-containing protein [Planctomycetota bacterium]